MNLHCLKRLKNFYNMKKIIEYSNFVEYIVSDNESTTIDCKLKSFDRNSKVHCHAVDKLTNSSISMINNRSLDIHKPISCILMIFVKINNVEVTKVYDISNHIGQDIDFSLDVFLLKDINGAEISFSDVLSSTDLSEVNCRFIFNINNSIKYKSETLSMFIKKTENIELITI